MSHHDARGAGPFLKKARPARSTGHGPHVGRPRRAARPRAGACGREEGGPNFADDQQPDFLATRTWNPGPAWGRRPPGAVMGDAWPLRLAAVTGPKRSYLVQLRRQGRPIVLQAPKLAATNGFARSSSRRAVTKEPAQVQPRIVPGPILDVTGVDRYGD